MHQDNPTLYSMVTKPQKKQKSEPASRIGFFYSFLSVNYVASVELSIASPMVFRPLSTYTTEPVTAEASGDAKKAAVLPTSSVEGILFDIKNMVRKWEESDTHCA